MLLWFPLAGSSALAASVSMQVQHGNAAEMAAMDMEAGDMSGCDLDQTLPDGKTFHNSCSNCQLACCACIAPAVAALPLPHLPSQEYQPLLVSFESFNSAPLLPPPLART